MQTKETITTGLSILSLVALMGCGADQETDIKISELQSKVLQLNVEFKEFKKTHQAELQSLKVEVAQLEKQTLRLKDISPMAAQQMQYRTRDQMRAEANQQSLMKREGRMEQRAVGLVRSLLRTHPISEIADFLNAKKILDPNDRPWTTERVKALIQEHKIVRTTPVESLIMIQKK
jgi:aminoglycoside N3'-acetyltransferase